MSTEQGPNPLDLSRKRNMDLFLQEQDEDDEEVVQPKDAKIARTVREVIEAQSKLIISQGEKLEAQGRQLVKVEAALKACIEQGQAQEKRILKMEGRNLWLCYINYVLYYIAFLPEFGNNRERKRDEYFARKYWSSRPLSELADATEEFFKTHGSFLLPHWDGDTSTEYGPKETQFVETLKVAVDEINKSNQNKPGTIASYDATNRQLAYELNFKNLKDTVSKWDEVSKLAGDFALLTLSRSGLLKKINVMIPTEYVMNNPSSRVN